MVRELMLVSALHLALIAGCDSKSSQLTAKSGAASEIHLSVLRSTDYAALVRVTVRRDCRGSASAGSPSICSKIEAVPDSVIERAALPFLKRHVSVTQAVAALEFWSSPEGAEISDTLVREIATQNPTLLSKRQLAKLDQFNKSDAGQALSRLSEDHELSITVLRAVEAYAP